jgi:hypothetical protein
MIDLMRIKQIEIEIPLKAIITSRNLGDLEGH